MFSAIWPLEGLKMAENEGAVPELRCEVCGAVFTSKVGLGTHKGKAHGGGASKNNRRKAKKGPQTTAPTPNPTPTPEPEKAKEDGVPYEEPPKTFAQAPSPSVPQIALGTCLLIDCTAWKLDSTTQQWVPEKASGLKVLVSSKVPSGNDILLCCLDASGGTWGVTQSAVLSGLVPIVVEQDLAGSVEEPAPTPEPAVAEPEPAQEPTPEPPATEEPLPPKPSKKSIPLTEFIYLAERYVELKDTFEIARNSFESFADLHERTLVQFIQQNGEDGYFKSKDGKIVGQVSSDPARGVVYDEDAIIAWCQENGQDDLLTLKFDVAKWTLFKESLGEALYTEGFKEILAKVESGEAATSFSIRKI
jgi:hypothetical protein